MKAITSELWDTGIEIITTENDCNEISSISDLKKCDNVLVGDKLKGLPYYEIILNDSILIVSFRAVMHPTGCGRLRICEIQ